jgi:hypothetical protein
VNTTVARPPSREELVADPKVAARFMNTYARRFSAGAFATPMASEIRALMMPGAAGGFLAWDGGCAVMKTVARPSKRRDFTGREYVIPANTQVVTHLATSPGSQVPNLTWAGLVYAYAEDTDLTAQLAAQGREVRAVRVSAASEIINAWGRPGTGATYPTVDQATIRSINQPFGVTLFDRVIAEATALEGWLDDFPFYSDGSWAALNLRGFKPSDPSWGIKPSEMSKSWWAEHPEAKSLTTCGWTVLADRCPATRALVESVGWWGNLERVRFLRMAGRGGKGGKLSRHSDVTDKAAGTRDGMITRFHIPLVTHPDIRMTAWNLRGESAAVHLPTASTFYLDARKPHAVTNPTGVDRIHLVVDVLADERVRRMIDEGTEYVG